MTDEELDVYTWAQDVKDAVKTKTTRAEYIAMHKPVYRDVAARAWDRYSPTPVPVSHCSHCGEAIERGESYCRPCDPTL